MLVVRPHTVFRHAWILVQPLKKIFSPSYSLRSRIAKCRDLWFFFSELPLYCPGCIPMNLKILYHPWCWGHLSSLSTTLVLTGHLNVEANFRMKAWEQNDHHFKIIWEDTTIANLKSLSWDNYKKCVCLELDDGMDVDLWFIYMHFYKFGIHTCWIWMFICLF